MKALKKLMAILLALTLSVGLLAGCSSADDGAAAPEEAATNEDAGDGGGEEATNTDADTNNGDTIKIGVSFATELAARWEYDELFMRQTAESLGAELLVQWANYEQAKQENQVENLITQGIDVLVLIAVSTNMGPLVEKVKDEGIPVVCYDNFIQDAPMDAYLDRDNVEAGRIQMEATAEAIGGEGNVVIIHGEPTSAVVQGMKVGYDEVLESYPDINVVAEQYCTGYSAEDALKVAENALSANNDDIQAFVCTADVLTIGILPAVEASGLSGEAYLTGMDCEVAAMQAVNEGIIGIDIWTEIDKCAIRAAEIAYALAVGEDFEYDEMMDNGGYQVPKTFVPIMGVTKDNMEQWVNEVAPEGWITMEQITG